MGVLGLLTCLTRDSPENSKSVYSSLVKTPGDCEDESEDFCGTSGAAKSQWGHLRHLDCYDAMKYKC